MMSKLIETEYQHQNQFLQVDIMLVFSSLQSILPFVKNRDAMIPISNWCWKLMMKSIDIMRHEPFFVCPHPADLFINDKRAWCAELRTWVFSSSTRKERSFLGCPEMGEDWTSRYVSNSYRFNIFLKHVVIQADFVIFLSQYKFPILIILIFPSLYQISSS